MVNETHKDIIVDMTSHLPSFPDHTLSNSVLALASNFCVTTILTGCTNNEYINYLKLTLLERPLLLHL